MPTKITIITSCTGQKAFKPDNQLTQDDFKSLGTKKFSTLEASFNGQTCPAEEMYTGQQHVRLMRGVEALRKAKGVKVDVHIVSAGYGVIPGDRVIAPYEVTFQGMKKKPLREWADFLKVPEGIRKVIKKKADLIVLLLGDQYLEACKLGDDVKLGGPTIAFCGTRAIKTLPDVSSLRGVPLSNPEAKRFSCGLVSLKGELVCRVLEKISTAGQGAINEIIGVNDVLECLESHKVVSPESPTKDRPSTEIDPALDQVIDISKEWWDRPQRDRLMYYIPEWDDQVDLNYDFVNDTHSGGRGHWGNQVYAHQMYKVGPRYDGILVSRVVAEKGKKKAKAVNKLGIHRYLRVPPEYQVMGDCGAFDYITEKDPPYTTEDVVDYYTRLGFNAGVSVDHLIVPAFEAENKYRYDLTIQNAEDFIKLHRKRNISWTPIGAVQGWSPESYAEAAAKYVEMGYDYIGLGGLVRSTTTEVVSVVHAVRRAVPKSMRIHLFGLARFAAIRTFADLGVTSIDSASMLRKAWLGNNLNFLTENGWYPAIRVPQAAKEDPKNPGRMKPSSFRAKRLIDEGAIKQEDLIRLEHACLDGLIKFGESQKKAPTTSLVGHLVEYDTLLAGERKGTEGRIRRVLEDRPWEMCGCDICSRWGIQVAIFRGDNRNRRRGFHNTHVFYEIMARLLDGERFEWIDDDAIHNGQMKLFDEELQEE